MPVEKRVFSRDASVGQAVSKVCGSSRNSWGGSGGDRECLGGSSNTLTTRTPDCWPPQRQAPPPTLCLAPLSQSTALWLGSGPSLPRVHCKFLSKILQEVRLQSLPNSLSLIY